ncbi:MAG: class I SAM-dependent methyltransferase [Chloroflexota bacterium]
MAEGPAHGVGSHELRHFFDERAHGWDSLSMPGTKERLEGIFAWLEIDPDGRVLDIGSGTGILLPFLLNRLDVFGSIVEMDIAAGMLKKGQEKESDRRVAFVQGDTHSLPFTTAAFDLVICHNTFPHFADQQRALCEMSRVTTAGGRVVISHTMSREAVNNFHQHIGGIVGHDRLPEDGVLAGWLEEAGFRWPSIEDVSERYLVVAWKGA